MQINDPVLFKGTYSKDFSIRGKIEEIDKIDNDLRYGVRLENGNFVRASGWQIKKPEEV